MSSDFEWKAEFVATQLSDLVSIEFPSWLPWIQILNSKELDIPNVFVERVIQALCDAGMANFFKMTAV